MRQEPGNEATLSHSRDVDIPFHVIAWITLYTAVHVGVRLVWNATLCFFLYLGVDSLSAITPAIHSLRNTSSRTHC